MTNENAIRGSAMSVTPPNQARRVFRIGLAVELGLAVVALAILPWIGDTGGWLRSGLGHLLYGIAGALPLLVMYHLLECCRTRSVRRVRRIVLLFVNRVLAGVSIPKLLLLAAAAGFGEELLFRGVIQGGLQQAFAVLMPQMAPVGLFIALIAASFFFGIMHAVTKLYFFLAFVIGLYLGLLFIVTDSLWPPIMAHALYDAHVFVDLRLRAAHRTSPRNPMAIAEKRDES